MNVACQSKYLTYVRLSGPGVTSVGSGGFVPYPGYEYFRNDLWFFNLTSSIWTQVEYPTDSQLPEARMDMVFLLLGDVIFMHGERCGDL
jgi:hypothetical protein